LLGWGRKEERGLDRRMPGEGTAGRDNNNKKYNNNNKGEKNERKKEGREIDRANGRRVVKGGGKGGNTEIGRQPWGLEPRPEGYLQHAARAGRRTVAVAVCCAVRICVCACVFNRGQVAGTYHRPRFFREDPYMGRPTVNSRARQ
jgi:hypothetical protein